MIISKLQFKCPHCKKLYSDDDYKYYDRANNNKNCSARLRCACGKIFYVTWDYMNHAVAYIRNNKKQKI